MFPRASPIHACVLIHRSLWPVPAPVPNLQQIKIEKTIAYRYDCTIAAKERQTPSRHGCGPKFCAKRLACHGKAVSGSTTQGAAMRKISEASRFDSRWRAKQERFFANRSPGRVCRRQPAHAKRDCFSCKTPCRTHSRFSPSFHKKRSLHAPDRSARAFPRGPALCYDAFISYATVTINS